MWLFFYSDNKAKQTDICVLNINNTLNTPETPKRLFNTENSIFTDLRCYTNETKSLCIFTENKKIKSLKKKRFYYRIYTNNFDLLVFDSVETDIKNDDKNYVLLAENGYALVTKNKLKTTVIYKDIKSSKSNYVDLSNNSDEFTVENIKVIAGNKLVLLNSYYNKQTEKYGLKKIILNLNSNTNEDEVVFEHKKINSWEISYGLLFDKTLITDDGICFVFTSQEPSSNPQHLKHFLSLVCIDSKSNKWEKVITDKLQGKSDDLVWFYKNGNLYISNNDKGFYKVDKFGKIESQIIEASTNKIIFNYSDKMLTNKGFILVKQQINGAIYGNSKFYKFELLD